MSGLSTQVIASIKKTIALFPEVTGLILYGSRAMGNYKQGSDIDLALLGNVSAATVARIHYLLNEETTIPYMVDVVAYETIENMALKEHIDNHGISL